MTYDVTISISKTEANNALNTAAEFVNVIRDIIDERIRRFNSNYIAYHSMIWSW